jgi:hypothetical protein
MNSEPTSYHGLAAQKQLRALASGPVAQAAQARTIG